MIKPYYENPFGKLYHGDCLEVMKDLDIKFDLVLTDPPYGTTNCKWDSVIPFDKMWSALRWVTEETTPIVLFGSQPFTSFLVCSNHKEFKYEWIWEKAVGSNFATVKFQPMKEHENILVFSKRKHFYNPIMQQRKGSGGDRIKYTYSESDTGEASGGLKFQGAEAGAYKNLRNPSSVQFFNNRESVRGLHPTQKPVALLEYLIKTYTNENQLVLDFTCGSGSTGVACINTNRNFVLIEKEDKYCEVSAKRLEEAYNKNISEIDL